MSEVRITDIYNPTVFNAAVQERAIERNAFLASGVLVADAMFNALASGPGSIGDMPFFFGLDNPQADGTNEPNYSNDNPAQTSTPAKITGENMLYRKAFLHNSWSTMDLARELALKDPLQAIVNRIGTYWAVNTQVRLIRSAMGVLADNEANDTGDMLYSIYSDIATPLAANKISSDAVIAAKATMGDHSEELTAIAMHSVIYAELQRQDLIVYLPTSTASIKIPTYLGYTVVVDDGMPVVAGTNSPAYTSILFSSASWALGTGSATVPSELERSASAGLGGGQDIIHSRGTNIIHPGGFAFISGSVAGQSPSFAELAAAANWNRVYANRKNIGMAFLRTNG